ncbi:unnamed protein product, partial [Rotaria sordida]
MKIATNICTNPRTTFDKTLDTTATL